MASIAVFFAEGFEEIEALTVVDLCRRAQIETVMVSIDGRRVVTGSHGIEVGMNAGLDEIDCSRFDMLVLPGGGPGTKRLEACGELLAEFDRFYAQGKWVAAICAAPSIFGHRGYLKGRRATSYPTFESQLEGAVVTGAAAEVDGNVITGRGMGCSVPFGLAIVAQLVSAEAADALADRIVYEGR